MLAQLRLAHVLDENRVGIEEGVPKADRRAAGRRRPQLLQLLLDGGVGARGARRRVRACRELARLPPKVFGQLCVEGRQRVAVERVQVEFAHEAVAVGRAECAWVGGEVELAQRRQRRQDAERRVEARDLVVEERERRQLGACAEGRERRDLVVRREELAQRNAVRERVEARDSVEVDVEHREVHQRGAAREGLHRVVRKRQHLERGEAGEERADFDHPELAQHQRAHVLYTLLSREFQQLRLAQLATHATCFLRLRGKLLWSSTTAVGGLNAPPPCGLVRPLLITPRCARKTRKRAAHSLDGTQNPENW
mmetsp:Transcript_16979/g.35981  ORF Transcript_16979/g.35981 Transcript_16979/m.35981 type:complete len:310 (-) Transcript_16979:237-1166(-)